MKNQSVADTFINIICFTLLAVVSIPFIYWTTFLVIIINSCLIIVENKKLNFNKNNEVSKGVYIAHIIEFIIKIIPIILIGISFYLLLKK